MENTECMLTIGALLHDFGKLLYRYNDNRKHSISGYEFVKDKIGIKDKCVLEQIHYHHSDLLKDANIDKNSLAYITYIADNISSAADRRENDEEKGGFKRDIPLESIFNILNGNSENKKYKPKFLTENINYPSDGEIKYTSDFYAKCIENLKDCIKAIDYDKKEKYINSLLEAMEANLSFVPSSTDLKEKADISLFDHSKTTAALACCIYQYLKSIGTDDYKTELFKNATKFYDKKAFLLYSIDMSGIQDFIYTISTDKALKSLRSRSFYLEILMEDIVDELLAELSLSRANLLYCGGGHAYMLLSNTQKTIKTIEVFEKELTNWFIKNFKTSLYVAGGFSKCSANDLQNKNEKNSDSSLKCNVDNLANTSEGRYGEIFRGISTNISKRKAERYTADDIRTLNNSSADGERECAVCRRTDVLDENNRCSVCAGLEKFSNDILNKDFFAVEKSEKGGLILPFGKSVSAYTKDEFKKILKTENYVRAYSKNEMYTGWGISAKMWVGDYKNGNTFEELAEKAEGIPRLGVLRADIDNLGQAFVHGFESHKNGNKYVTISRTSTFSRKLSIFFKLHIKNLLENGEFYITDKENGKRTAAIVYSGGDDVFIVGAWDEIIGFAVDLNDALKEYSQNKLTISAGIGIYPEKYPVSAMARQTGELEEMSKSQDGKNSITVFGEGNTYKWDEFVNDVICDKYVVIKDFFKCEKDKADGQKRGKAFLYRMLNLMRNHLAETEKQKGEKLNLARFAYVLSRLEPDSESDSYVKYKEFSRNMYKWIKDKKQCRQAITAIYMYVYTIREREDDDNDYK